MGALVGASSQASKAHDAACTAVPYYFFFVVYIKTLKKFFCETSLF